MLQAHTNRSPKIRASREFNERGYRWYPEILVNESPVSVHPHYIRPQGWVEKHCPEGFLNPIAAISFMKSQYF